MQELINIEDQEGKLVVSSRQIAEHFCKDHKHVLRDIEAFKSSGVAQNWADLFIESQYRHEQNKQLYKEFLLTREGFTLLGMGFTGNKALEWKLKYIEAFSRMEKEINNNFLNGISSEMKAIIMQDKKLQKVEVRIDHLENNVSISRSQQKQLRFFVNEVVVKALCSKHSNAYKLLKNKAFSQMWKDYQNYFNIASYLDTPKGRFNDALSFINGWQPAQDLKLMIIGANAQMALGD